ncbi:MAG: hypothetical protein IPL61_04680 [Myxococcales bacterium]|nr:hypothetical protein [Myxococcales bacterium]
MTAIDETMTQSFLVAAAELGMCSAAWLFVSEFGASGGAPLVTEARDRLGRDFPVLDAVCARYLDGQRGPVVDAARVQAACAGTRRLLVVGIETAFLDQLVPLIDAEIGLLTHGELDTDWARVLDNYGGRVVPYDLGTFQRCAGSRSALLTFLYGSGAALAHVNPAWLRVIAGDVRTQFRTLVGWDVLGGQMYVYPRWLVSAPLADFSHVIA